ncbi:MAG: MerR family transcriptional regulator [Pseudomonadota bacterium]
MLEPSNNSLLPEIPSKRYFTIGEVSELCDVKPHVLRYWEQEFPQLKPVKRRGNRRYYQRQDVMIIRTIRSLLYEQGYTIGGARLQLAETRLPEREASAIDTAAPALSMMGSSDGIFNVVLRDMIQELEQVATLLRR